MHSKRRLGVALLHLHQAVYDRSDGRVGHRLFGVRCLLVRSVGRRSGQRRTTALAYARDGPDYLVVGSLGGADIGPAWVHNVRASPSVELQVGRFRFPAAAHVVEQGDPGYERLWALVNGESGGRYARYQARTARPIPVVVLTPPETRPNWCHQFAGGARGWPVPGSEDA